MNIIRLCWAILLKEDAVGFNCNSRMLLTNNYDINLPVCLSGTNTLILIPKHIKRFNIDEHMGFGAFAVLETL